FAVAASAKDAASGQLEIVTLSNRADLISGGDALVEVRVPRSVAPSQVRLSLNGHDVTAMFRVDSTAGVMRGVLTGMVPGRNDFLADSKGRRASLTITNHAIGGPVLQGSQTTPWICATPTPVAESGNTPASNASGLTTFAFDAQCNIATEYKLFYRTTAAGCSIPPGRGRPCRRSRSGTARWSIPSAPRPASRGCSSAASRTGPMTRRCRAASWSSTTALRTRSTTRTAS